jgi:hypothetical protein
MFRFTIRDVLWLMVVAGLVLGWWLLWRSIPADARASGSISVAGKPLADGRVCLHSTNGQIIGARAVNGQFQIHNAPVGRFRVTIDGDGVASRYSADNSELSVEVRRGVNTFNFELR